MLNHCGLAAITLIYFLGLLLTAGCGDSAKPYEKTEAGEPNEMVEEVVDLLVPPAPEDSSPRLRKLNQRERETMRQLQVLVQRRQELARDRTLSDATIKELHGKMSEAREEYQRAIASIPEIEDIDARHKILEKQLHEMREIKRKLEK